MQTTPQTRQETREATLKGVIPGQSACAIIAVEDKEVLRQVGDTIAGYHIVAISEDSIRIKAPGHEAEPWIVGDTRRVPSDVAANGK